MKYKLFFLLLTGLLCQQLVAQQSGTELTFRKTFWSNGFYQGNTKITNAQVKEILAVNPTALSAYKKARTNQAFSTLFAGIGGALIGIPLGTAAGGGDANWGLAAVGGGFVIAAIPFDIAFTRKARAAVDTYNNGTGKTSGINPQLHVGFTSNGMGIRFSF